jgi:hypothetical protein
MPPLRVSLALFVAALIAACNGGSSSTTTDTGQDMSMDDAGTNTDDGATAGGADGGTTANDGGTAISALPSTAFVFVKTVRKETDHIFAYDTATNTATLISALDDNGTSGTHVYGIAISPDRKWVAFTGIFRPSLDDAKALTPDAVWIVSVDGSTYRRLTAPIPNTDTTPCTVDAQYQPLGEVCNTSLGQCRKALFSMDLYSPAWAPSGDTVWLDFQELWEDSPGHFAGGGSLATVSAQGGVMLPVMSHDSCEFLTSASIDRTGTKIAAERSICINGEQDGLVLFDIASKTTQLLFAGTIRSRPVYSPDGSGIAFIAWRGTSTFQDLLFYSFAKSQASTIIQAAGDQPAQGVQDVAIAPDSDHFVIVTGNNLYLYQASMLMAGPKMLTSDGMNSAPSW